MKELEEKNKILEKEQKLAELQLEKISKGKNFENKLKNISTNIPNPKTYEAYRFYEKNNMRINKIPLNEEISQLNDSLIRKEPINGDSMMISEITKARKNIKLEKMKKILKLLKMKKLIMMILIILIIFVIIK